MFNYDDYRDLVDFTDARLVSLSPASIVLANMFSAQWSAFSFHQDYEPLDASQIDEVEVEIGDFFNEINEAYTCPITIFQKFRGETIPSWGFTSPTSAGNVGMRFDPQVDGLIYSVRYYVRTTGYTNGAIGGLFTNTGTLLQQQNFANNPLGWHRVKFDPPIEVVAGSRYVAVVYTPNTSHPFELSALGSDITAGDLIIRADNTGGVPSCPGSSGAFGFPTTGSSSARNYVDVEFIANA